MTRAMPAVALFFCAASSFAQTPNWLPISDLPLTHDEVNGIPAGPGLGSACMWDPDGPGPLSKCLTVSGYLGLTVHNADKVAYLDDSGWHGLSPTGISGAVYSMVAYTAPGEDHEDLYVATSSGGLYRFNGSLWTRVIQSSNNYSMIVADMDGPGPQPPKIIMGSAAGVYTYDGTTATRLTGGTSTINVHAVHVWDADGTGPLPPVLLAYSPASPPGIRKWDGTTWTQFASVPNSGLVYKIGEFNFGESGTGSPELVIAGSYFTIGGVDTGPLAVYRNGSWVGLGIFPYNIGYLDNFISFDPDGDGPLTPWLVVAGNYSQISGITVPKLSYWNDGAWHAFPSYWNTVSASLLTTTDAPFSDSPQLIVGGVQGRPSLGRFAISDHLGGVVEDPRDTTDPLGGTATIAVIPSGDELTFRWFKEEVALNDGPTASGSEISGVYGSRLTITNLSPSDVGRYRVEIGNALGIVTSHFATIAIGCAADFNSDNGVDMFDYLDFVQAFSDGAAAADFNRDSAIDFFDYLDFVQAFSTGC